MKLKLFLVIFAIFSIIFMVSCKKESDMTKKTDDKPMVQTVTYKGVMMDVTCGTSGKGMDGSAVITNPEDHTVHCLEACAASGFGIMVKNEGKDYYSYIQFDNNGSLLANEILKNTKKDKNLTIEVTGELQDDGILKVTDLKEI